MKVYIKKEDKHPITVTVIATIVLFVFPVAIFLYTFLWSGGCDDVMGVLEEYGALLIVSAILFVIGLFSIYSLFKKPVGYNAKLVHKESQTYEGQQITYMVFETLREKDQKNPSIPDNYKCYIVGDNSLVEGSEYNLLIKEFSRRPRAVEELKNGQVHKERGASMIPVFYMIALLPGGLFIIYTVKLIFYSGDFMEWLVCALVLAITLLLVHTMAKAWRVDNDETKDNGYAESQQKLRSISPLSDRQEKVGDTKVRPLIIATIIIVMLSTGAFFFGMPISQMGGLIFVGSLVELALCINILPNIGLEKRVIEKRNIKTDKQINLADIRTFKVARISKNTRTTHFFITDKDNNLIFKVKTGGFLETKSIVCSPDNIKIGEIKLNGFSIANEYLIRIVNEPPFIVRSKLQFQDGFHIIGRNYSAEGDPEANQDVIYDDKGEEIARISTIQDDGQDCMFGDSETTLSENTENNIDIMMIALCITMTNLRTFNRLKDDV